LLVAVPPDVVAVIVPVLAPVGTVTVILVAVSYETVATVRGRAKASLSP
jgi:hypothetical protein